jgi:predicted nucleic acid-binding protein
VWTTTVAASRIRFGLKLLAPDGRREDLDAAFAKATDEVLEGRALRFDQRAAHAAGAIATRQRQAGRPVGVRDIQIAGIAAPRKAMLATRNTQHFEGLGVALVDPWRDRL